MLPRGCRRPAAAIKRMTDEMRNRYECKIQVLGLDTQNDDQLKAPHRSTICQMMNKDAVISYEADPRHSEIIVQALRLHTTFLTTRVVKMDWGEDGQPLDEFHTIR